MKAFAVFASALLILVGAAIVLGLALVPAMMQMPGWMIQNILMIGIASCTIGSAFLIVIFNDEGMRPLLFFVVVCLLVALMVYVNIQLPVAPSLPPVPDTIPSDPIMPVVPAPVFPTPLPHPVYPTV